MNVEIPDLRDDALLAVMLTNRNAALAATRHRVHAMTFDEWAKVLRHVDSGERAEYAVARDDAGRVVGHVWLWFPLHDNRDKVWLDVLVHPDHWRHGAGTALVQWGVGRARADRRGQVLVEATVPAHVDADAAHPVTLFAQSVGFRVSNVEIVRECPLPVDPKVLDEQWDSARAWSDEYDVDVYFDGVPDALKPSVCGVMNQLGVDAPTGEVQFEAETQDVGRYDDFLQHEKEIGRHRMTAVAVHRGSGEVVAYSDIALPAGDPELALQWGTLVVREHRGHRLGTAVKVANLRALAEQFPQRRVVQTCNAETNRWMVAINEALGFRVVEKKLALVRDL